MDDVSKGFMVKAQQCLAKNDFLKALDHLDAVIRRCRPAQRAPIEALDRRAATYIQLQRFADAFQDSKRMIREHKTDARGYLRTVQVLKYQAQEKKDDAYIQSALKVAKSGLDNSRKGDALHYKQLARVHEDLKNPPKVVRHDPAQKLPTELFFEILKHMQTSDLMKARRTSRSWNSMITGNPRFWTSLAITRKFNARGIATLLNFATDASRQCQVTELTIGWLPEPKNAHEVIRNLLKKCSRLRTLDIRTWDNPEKPYWAGVKLSELRSLKLRISRVGGSLKWLSASAKAFPCLEQLALIPDVNIGYPGFDDDSEAIQWPGSLPNLKSFCMHDVAEGHRPLTSVLNLRLDVLATSAPWLERLELKGLDLNLEMSSGEGILTHFKQLKEVRVRNLGSGSLNLSTSSPIDTLELLRPLLWTDSIPRLMWVQAVDQVSSLKRLSISSRLTEPSEWLQFFKESQCRLEKLSIEPHAWESRPSHPDPRLSAEAYIRTLSPVLQESLIELALAYDSFVITDELAKLLTASLPKLEVVSFPDETSLTGVGVHALATGLPRLRYLDVGKSPSLKLDVIPFCRQRGIELRGVIGSQEKEVGSGRLVRY